MILSNNLGPPASHIEHITEHRTKIFFFDNRSRYENKPPQSLGCMCKIQPTKQGLSKLACKQRARASLYGWGKKNLFPCFQVVIWTSAYNFSPRESLDARSSVSKAARHKRGKCIQLKHKPWCNNGCSLLLKTLYSSACRCSPWAEITWAISQHVETWEISYSDSIFHWKCLPRLLGVFICVCFHLVL